MNRVGVCRILLIAGSMLGSSITLAAAADPDRPVVAGVAKSKDAVAKPSAAVPRSTRSVRGRPARVQPTAAWQVHWPHRSYEQVAIRWPLLFVGVGY